MEVTSGYVRDPREAEVYPGMTFENSYGTCTVIGPRDVGTLWDVELHDGRIHPMRPSTILVAAASDMGIGQRIEAIKAETQHVNVTSAIATRIRDEEDDWTRQTEWNGDLPVMDTEEAFRFFNRVTEADAKRLEDIGYRLPSMSVGDLLTLGTETFQVKSVGFEKVDPPAPCGYCRRCAIHDDPGGCSEVEAWVRETLKSYR